MVQGKQIEVRRRKLPYTNVKNDLIWDDRLRLQTRFALIAMLSLPDDWDYSIRGMAAKLKISKDTMAKMLKELEETGYLKRKAQEHVHSGQFGKARYVLTDVPNDFGEEEGEGLELETAQPNVDKCAPCPGLPYTVSPYTKNSPQQNNKQQTNKQDTPIVPPRGDGASGKRKGRTYKPVPDWKPERFAKFWEFYPRGENKQAAIRAWDKLRAEDSLIDTMAAALVRQKKRADWQQGVGIPYASTWLNGRRWEDEERGPDTAQPEAPQPRKYHMAVIDGEEVVVYDD